MHKLAPALASAIFVAGSMLYGSPIVAASSSRPQQPAAAGEVKLKKEEYDAFKAIEGAAGFDARLAAAKEFVAKFPSSPAASAVEELVYDVVISSPTDPKAATNIAAFGELYPSSKHLGDLQLFLFDHHVQAQQWAAANQVGEAYLAKWPDDARLHFRMLEIGLEAAKQKDGSLVPSAKTHGQKAIELFVGDKKPAAMADADWATYKQRSLPKAHQSLGLIAYVTADFAGAESHLAEAAKLNPSDPFNYFFLGAVAETRYRDVAEKFNAMPDAQKGGAEGKKLIDESAAQEDILIGHFVKVIAYGSGKPEFDALVAQARPALEEHYKHRHKNSLDGLEQMITAAKGAQ